MEPVSELVSALIYLGSFAAGVTALFAYWSVAVMAYRGRITSGEGLPGLLGWMARHYLKDPTSTFGIIWFTLLVLSLEVCVAAFLLPVGRISIGGRLIAVACFAVEWWWWVHLRRHV